MGYLGRILKYYFFLLSKQTKVLKQYIKILEELCMKEKIKKFINIKRIGKVGLALTSLFCYTNTCYLILISPVLH